MESERNWTTLEQLADREAIRDCVYRYSRGVDRMDAEMLRSAYWEDAYDDHVLFQGSRDGFVEWVMPQLRRWERSQHLVGNIFIRLDGNEAAVESYFQGYHCNIGTDGRREDDFTGGRYLDTMQKRGKEWRISRRI